MKQLYISFIYLSTNMDSIAKKKLIDSSWQKILLKKNDNRAIETYKSENGKPFIASPEPWYYNISHSKSLAVSILSSQPVGIDLELISNKRNTADIAHEYFTQNEQQLCKTSIENFYLIWTRKEAWIKLHDQTVWNMKQTPEMIDTGKSIVSWKLSHQSSQYAMSVALAGEDEFEISWYNSEQLKCSPSNCFF